MNRPEPRSFPPRNKGFEDTPRILIEGAARLISESGSDAPTVGMVQRFGKEQRRMLRRDALLDA